jgi:hypothetical protein
MEAKMNDIKGSKYLIVFIILTLALLSTFTFALHAGNKNPPVALSFGSLDPNEEMLKVIMENKGE